MAIYIMQTEIHAMKILFRTGTLEILSLGIFLLSFCTDSLWGKYCFAEPIAVVRWQISKGALIWFDWQNLMNSSLVSWFQ